MVKEEDGLRWREEVRRIIQKARIYPIFSANWLDYQDKIEESKPKCKDILKKKKNTTQKTPTEHYRNEECSWLFISTKKKDQR